MSKVYKTWTISLLSIGLLTTLIMFLGSHIYLKGVVDGQYLACEASLAINAKTGPFELYCSQENDITYVKSRAIPDVELELSSPDDLRRLHYREQ